MSIILAHPLPGSTLSDAYGWRGAIPSIGLAAQLHNGQDYAAPGGTPIRAAHNGRVAWSDYDQIGGGWGVLLAHDDGWATLYFHMRAKSTDVTVGQRVTTGQTIGRVGSSGLATGDHLHFMLRVGGKDIDPVPYITSHAPSSNAPAGQEEEDPMSYIFIGGKAGARRGGVYAVIGRQAVFLPGVKAKDVGAATVTDETAIRALQGLISGLQ